MPLECLGRPTICLGIPSKIHSEGSYPEAPFFLLHARGFLLLGWVSFFCLSSCLVGCLLFVVLGLASCFFCFLLCSCLVGFLLLFFFLLPWGGGRGGGTFGVLGPAPGELKLPPPPSSPLEPSRLASKLGPVRPLSPSPRLRGCL